MYDKSSDEIVRLQDEVLAGLPSLSFCVPILSRCWKNASGRRIIRLGPGTGDFAGVSTFITRILTRKISRCLLVTVDASGLKTANNKLCMVRKEYRGNSPNTGWSPA